MRIEDLFENKKQKLSEQPALAGVLGTGLDPAQFQQRTGVSPANATKTINNIVRMNPQFKTPQFKSAITNFLIDNPKAMQAATQNFANANTNIKTLKSPGLGSKLGAFAKTALGRLAGGLAIAITGTATADGTISADQQEAWNQAESFLNHLSTNDPQQFVDMIDAEMKNADKEDPQFVDLKTDPRYISAANALTQAAAQAVPKPLDTPPDADPKSPAQPKPANDPKPPIRVVPPPAEPAPEQPVTPDNTPPKPSPRPAPAQPKPETKPDTKPGAPKPETKPDTKPRPEKPSPNTKPDTKPEVKPEPAPNADPKSPAQPKPETKPDTKPGAPKPETKPDTKPRPEKPSPNTKPDTKPETDPVSPNSPKTTPGTIPTPGSSTSPDLGPSPLPLPRLNPKGTGKGKGRGRGKLGLPRIPGIGMPDATAMTFRPLQLKDPLNLRIGN